MKTKHDGDDARSDQPQLRASESDLRGDQMHMGDQLRKAFTHTLTAYGLDPRPNTYANVIEALDQCLAYERDSGQLGVWKSFADFIGSDPRVSPKWRAGTVQPQQETLSPSVGDTPPT